MYCSDEDTDQFDILKYAGCNPSSKCPGKTDSYLKVKIPEWTTYNGDILAKGELCHVTLLNAKRRAYNAIEIELTILKKVKVGAYGTDHVKLLQPKVAYKVRTLESGAAKLVGVPTDSDSEGSVYSFRVRLATYRWYWDPVVNSWGWFTSWFSSALPWGEYEDKLSETYHGFSFTEKKDETKPAAKPAESDEAKPAEKPAESQPTVSAEATVSTQPDSQPSSTEP